MQTKLYIPAVWPKVVHRPRLINRLDQGQQLGHKLAAISAPAGFGKTTLVSEWVYQKVGGGRMRDDSPGHYALKAVGRSRK